MKRTGLETYVIMTNPKGKMSAAMSRSSPGAFAAYQGLALQLSTAAQAKDSRHPAETPERNTLSGRVLPLITPARPTSSMVWVGEKAERLVTRTRVGSAAMLVDVSARATNCC